MGIYSACHLTRHSSFQCETGEGLGMRLIDTHLGFPVYYMKLTYNALSYHRKVEFMLTLFITPMLVTSDELAAGD